MAELKWRWDVVRSALVDVGVEPDGMRALDVKAQMVKFQRWWPSSADGAYQCAFAALSRLNNLAEQRERRMSHDTGCTSYTDVTR